MRGKKAAGFPIFYRTPQSLVWQGFQPLHSALYRTERVARTAENPKNRRGFPFYSSGASNPKGSGAQYCSPPNTVIGIETPLSSSDKSLSTNCSPPNTVIGIETRILQPPLTKALSYCSPPNTVIGIETTRLTVVISRRTYCSPPNTVIGIETSYLKVAECDRTHIAALLIPSSVFSSSSF